MESAEPEAKTFPLDYVQELRAENAHYRTKAKELETAQTVGQKGYLPPDVNVANSDVAFHINKFPLGDIDNYHVSSVAMCKALSGGRMYGSAWDTWAPWEKQYLDALREVKFKALSETQYKAQGDQVSGIDGGFLAPEIWNLRWFDLLRSLSAIDQLPVTRMTVPARVQHIPKVLIDVTVSYPGENAQPTATQFKFGQLTYTARKAEAVINISNELIRDSAGLADTVLRQSTAGAIATDRDTQLFVGQSSGGATTAAAPMGFISNSVGQNFTYYPVTSVSGTISTTPGSFTPSYQHIGQLIAKVEVLSQFSGVQVGQTTVNGAVANPQFKQTVWSSSRFQTATTAQPIWVDDLNVRNGLFGLKWALTNVIPTNLSYGGGSSNESLIIVGDWRQYVLFECLTLGFDASIFPGTSSVGFSADQTQVRVVHRYDGQPVHPEAFAVLAGVLV